MNQLRTDRFLREHCDAEAFCMTNECLCLSLPVLLLFITFSLISYSSAFVFTFIGSLHVVYLVMKALTQPAEDCIGPWKPVLSRLKCYGAGITVSLYPVSASATPAQLATDSKCRFSHTVIQTGTCTHARMRRFFSPPSCHGTAVN